MGKLVQVFEKEAIEGKMAIINFLRENEKAFYIEFKEEEAHEYFLKNYPQYYGKESDRNMFDLKNVGSLAPTTTVLALVKKMDRAKKCINVHLQQMMHYNNEDYLHPLHWPVQPEGFKIQFPVSLIKSINPVFHC